MLTTPTYLPAFGKMELSCLDDLRRLEDTRDGYQALQEYVGSDIPAELPGVSPEFWDHFRDLVLQTESGRVSGLARSLLTQAKLLPNSPEKTRLLSTLRAILTHFAKFLETYPTIEEVERERVRREHYTGELSTLEQNYLETLRVIERRSHVGLVQFALYLRRQQAELQERYPDFYEKAVASSERFERQLSLSEYYAQMATIMREDEQYAQDLTTLNGLILRYIQEVRRGETVLAD